MSSDQKRPEKEIRKEYEVVEPIIQAGEEIKSPRKVKLTASQAEKLKKSGHIK